MSRPLKLYAWTLTTLLAAACSKVSAPASAGPPGGGGGTTTATTGIALPEEVSALPPEAQVTPHASTALRAGSFRELATALTAAALPSDSDYATATTVKWVNEQALSRFDILNSIFKAIGQTNYADAANVGAGPYGANVTSVGDGKDSQILAVNPTLDGFVDGSGAPFPATLNTWVNVNTGGPIWIAYTGSVGEEAGHLDRSRHEPADLRP